jgi:hypothetical protein
MLDKQHGINFLKSQLLNYYVQLNSTLLENTFNFFLKINQHFETHYSTFNIFYNLQHFFTTFNIFHHLFQHSTNKI